jgi:hypothetical protein
MRPPCGSYAPVMAPAPDASGTSSGPVPSTGAGSAWTGVEDGPDGEAAERAPVTPYPAAQTCGRERIGCPVRAASFISSAR